MRNLLFLDIDGVLNTREFLRDQPTRDPRWDLMPEKVRLLADWLVDQNNLDVVLCSDWRLFYPLPMIQRALRHWAPHFPPIAGVTPGTIDGVRGDEILLYLEGQLEHSCVNSVVVLDDDPAAGRNGLHSVLVQTSAWVGLMPRNLERMAALLSMPNNVRNVL